MRKIKQLVSAVLCLAVSMAATAVMAAPDGVAPVVKLKEAVILFLGSPQAFIKNQPAAVDTENPNAAPMLVNDRTLVPLRFVAEGFDAVVDWNGQDATVKQNGNTVIFTAGSAAYTINGAQKALDVAAQIYDGRIYIPLRAVTEALGKQVFWADGLIILSDIPDIFDPVAEAEQIRLIQAAFQ